MDLDEHRRSRAGEKGRPARARSSKGSPPTHEAVPTRRAYNSTRRARQAAQTRQEVLAAASALFGEQGWTGTTVAAIAERAEVAVETVYSSYGSKKKLLRAAMDAAIVGDVEDVPLSERAEYRALADGSRAERIRKAVQLTRTIHERSAGVWQAILEAAPGDAEIEGWRQELEGQRRAQVADALHLVLGRDVEPSTLELVVLLIGPEAYLRLTTDGGFDAATYDDTMCEALDRLTRTSGGGRRPSKGTAS